MPDNLLSRATPGPVSIESKARSTPPTPPYQPKRSTSVWIRPLIDHYAVSQNVSSCYARPQPSRKVWSVPFNFYIRRVCFPIFVIFCHVCNVLKILNPQKHVLEPRSKKIVQDVWDLSCLASADPDGLVHTDKRWRYSQYNSNTLNLLRPFAKKKDARPSSRFRNLLGSLYLTREYDGISHVKVWSSEPKIGIPDRKQPSSRVA